MWRLEEYGSQRVGKAMNFGVGQWYVEHSERMVDYTWRTEVKGGVGKGK